jgi:acetylornithine deacetylase/succinyl-diaminopimelate desuccinylase family protein
LGAGFDLSIAAAVDSTEIGALLQRLVEADTSNPPGNERVAAETLRSFLTAAGLQCTIQELGGGRANLIARLGTDETPSIMLNGHLDTMPAGSGWNSDPHKAEITGDRLVGLGAADMKAGLAAAAGAAAAIARIGARLHGTLVVTAVADEESQGLGARALMAAGVSADCAVVTEPTELRLMVAGNGQIDYEVAITGIPAHASTPWEGRNAILGARPLLALLEAEAQRLRQVRHPLTGSASLNVGQIRGGTNPSVVAADCQVTLDRRLIPGESLETAVRELDAVVEAVRLRCPKLRFEGRPLLAIPPLEQPVNLPIAQILREAGWPVTGRMLALGGLSATTDAQTFVAAGVPTVVFGPGSIAHAAHRANEAVSLTETTQAAKILALAVTKFLEE